MAETRYSSDGKFEGNVLVVGRTGCGKTTFVQNLARNKLFGDIKEVFWISKIDLSNEREDNIRDCFQNQHVGFNYLNNLEDFEYLLEMCKRDKAEYAENNLGEQMVLDKLIAMDDVSGLADNSDEFANFLTVSHKYSITCVYIFHTIYPSRQNWQMIMSQTQIFNFFSDSIQAGAIVRLLSSFAIRIKNGYLPHRNVWINKLYFHISNSQEKQCLTVDARDVSSLGPGKFRTLADNDIKQVCYYNRNKKDTCFNSFLATREETSQEDDIKFSIVKVIDNVNKNSVIYSEVTNELNNFKDDIGGRTVQSISGDNIEGRTTARETSARTRRTNDDRRVSKKPRFLSRK